jgi:hypothetical protein
LDRSCEIDPALDSMAHDERIQIGEDGLHLGCERIAGAAR